MHLHQTDRAPRLLVVQPDPTGPLDRFEGWLAEAGVDTRVVRPYAGEVLPHRLEEDGLIVLGGDMSANDDDLYPWLADIRGLLAQAVELGRPTLGICLGGQLLARATGGRVVRGDNGLEAGVVEVQWTAEARSDRLTADLPEPFLSGGMHGDMIDLLPPGAVWLGRSEQYPHQAFRLGPLAWGLQFHPEVSPAGYRGWVEEFEGDDPRDLALLRAGVADFDRLDPQVTAGTAALAARFAGLVRSGAATR